MPTIYEPVAAMILDQGGFGALSAEQKKQYVPALAALIEERVGIELLPRLNDEQTEALIALTERAGTTAEEWQKFWSAAVPNFEAEMARIVGEFAASG